MDHLNSIKDFTESNHPLLPSTTHRNTCPQSPAAVVLLLQRDSFICLNMVGIKVADSSFTQVVVGHLRSILVLFTDKDGLIGSISPCYVFYIYKSVELCNHPPDQTDEQLRQ